jgi:hypothetical protein
VGVLAVLDERPDDGDAGRPQELLELGEVLAGRERRDADGPLLGPARAGRASRVSLRIASASRSLDTSVYDESATDRRSGCYVGGSPADQSSRSESSSGPSAIKRLRLIGA